MVNVFKEFCNDCCYTQHMSPFLNPPFIIAILIALSVHEWAHGYAAYRLGDPTAKYSGRLTLNPLAHLDPIGTIMFLFVGFGWGKPVPIDPRNFKNYKRDSAITALAGPLSNFILAWISFMGLVALSGNGTHTSMMSLLRISEAGNPATLLLIQIFASSLFINLALMAFNLLPVAPLDGSKIVRPFVPVRYDDMYQDFMRRGPMFLIFLLVIEAFLHVPILSGWVFGIITPILLSMNAAAGLFL